MNDAIRAEWGARDVARYATALAGEVKHRKVLEAECVALRMEVEVLRALVVEGRTVAFAGLLP